MANVKISELPLATSPLDSTVEMPVVQGGVTKRAGMTAIGFLQAGTGAVLQTAQDKMRETVTVTDFGAVDDGATDCRAAFIDALAALPNGGILRVPAAAVSYYVDNSAGEITVPSDVAIVGEGNASAITINTTTLNGLFTCGANDNTAFRGLKLIGNRLTQPSASSSSVAIKSAPGSSGIEISDCIIIDWTRHGIALDGVTNAMVQRNHVERTQLGSGILFSTTTASYDVTVTNNTVRDTQQGNIQTYFGVQRFVVTNNICSVTDFTAAGEIADNITSYTEDLNGILKDVVIANNVLSDSGNHGIHVGGDNIAISGNTILNPARYGILFAKADNLTPDPSDGVSITGNTVTYGAGALPTTARAIGVRNTSGFSVTGNTIVGGETGIEVNGIDTAGDGCTIGIVSNNVILDYTVYGVWMRNKVTQTQVTNNVMRGSGASNDVRTDYVSALATDNRVQYNLVQNGGTLDAQFVQAPAYNSHFFTTAGGRHLDVGNSTANIVNRLQIIGNITNSPPTVTALGNDTDIDMRFLPKGGGRLRFGTHTASADVPVTGYVEIKDASGVVRRLAVVS